MGLRYVETAGERRPKVVEIGEARSFSGLILCGHRRHERSNTHDVHGASEIVGLVRHAVSLTTRGSIFMRKWVAPIRALIVPKGCSTVSRR